MSAALGGSPHAMGVDLGNGLFLFDTALVPATMRSAVASTTPPGGQALEVFETTDQAMMIAPEEFIAQFVPGLGRTDIDAFNRINKVSIVREIEWERNAFVLRVDDPVEASSVDKANLYQESGKVVWVRLFHDARRRKEDRSLDELEVWPFGWKRVGDVAVGVA
jgi:hypothetical protein